MADDDRLRTALLAASDDLKIRPTLVNDVRRGARRRRRLRIGLVTGCTAVVVVLASVAGAYGYSLKKPTRQPLVPAASPAAKLPAACAVEALPLPDGQTSSIVTGGDRTGHYLVGRSQDGDGKFTVLVWHDGQLTGQAEMPGLDGTLDDINSAGVAIGNSVPDGGGNTPWLFRDGQLTELTAPGEGAGKATAKAIGEQGTVVGSRRALGGGQAPVTWPTGESTATDLKISSGGALGEAEDVDADGTIIGRIEYPIDPFYAAVWRPGGDGSERLPAVGHSLETRNLLPISISDGVVAGRWGGPSGPAMTLDLKTGTATVLDRAKGAGQMNARAWFAGRTTDGLALLSTTARTELPVGNLGDVASDQTVVRSLSDDGKVIGGQVADPDGNTRAAIWHCK
jgi:uncharacterized membrane protein